MYLRSLTDKELARYADTMLDPMLSSTLEQELTRRFSQIVETDSVQSISELSFERNNLIRLLRFKIKPTITDPNLLVLIDEALAPYSMEKPA